LASADAFDLGDQKQRWRGQRGLQSRSTTLSSGQTDARPQSKKSTAVARKGETREPQQKFDLEAELKILEERLDWNRRQYDMKPVPPLPTKGKSGSTIKQPLESRSVLSEKRSK